jgi:hypothetical protein
LRLFARKPRVAVPAAPLDLPRDEMAFRKQYQSLLLTQKLTTVFRPGDRRAPAWRGYAPGEVVTARVIARVGSDALGVPPVFNDVRMPILIQSVTLRSLETLTSDDFAGSSPDVRDPSSLAAHLEGIYGRPLASWGSLVTRIAFSYVGPRHTRWSRRRSD